MRIFQYLQPRTVEDAINMLNRHGQEAKLVAGGTDLLIQMEKKSLTYPYLIGLTRIEGLSYIRDDPARKIVQLGAMTLIQDIADSPLIKEKYYFLADACRQLGSVQVRNIATLGGNLCNAAPSAETAPPLVALESQAVVAGRGGKRNIPLGEFFLGPGKTALELDEILLEVQIPYPQDGTRGSYQKLSHRRGVDIAVVNAAALMKISLLEICEAIEIVLGAVAPVPLRARKAESIMVGKRLSEDLIREAARVSSEEASPITDVRGTAEYRREMVEVLVSRAMKEIWKGIP